MNWIDSALQALAHAPAMRVCVSVTQGSAPRESGTCMLVSLQGQWGTIGGGHLEHTAIAHARALLAEGRAQDAQRHVLGPSLGQCCGGVVHLAFTRVQAEDAPALRAELEGPRWPLALFGGGHVGHALVQALMPLPFAVRWVDSRDEIFPPDLPAWIQTEHSDPVQGAVAELAPGSRVLIMSFSHAEDLDIVMACLRRIRERDDLPFVGLIGSKTKWASFRHRLQERGFAEAELARITSPIGLPGIVGKAPAVIAAAVVAQLLLQTGG